MQTVGYDPGGTGLGNVALVITVVLVTSPAGGGAGTVDRCSS